VNIILFLIYRSFSRISLSKIGRHGMGSITQQRDASFPPLRKWFEIIDIVTKDGLLICCFDQLFNRFVPVLEPVP
jgi:hypothetical protein